MAIINRLTGGGKPLQIGDITQEDKSGDSNFALCCGANIPKTIYTDLDNVLECTPKYLSQLSSYNDGAGNVSNIAVATDGNIIVSSLYSSVNTITDNGTNWTQRLSFVSNFIEFYENIFILLGNSKLYTSTDGITWTARINEYVSGITVTSDDINNRLFVTKERNGICYKSTDGITWVSVSIPYTISNGGHCGGNGWIIMSNANGMYKTADLVEWETLSTNVFNSTQIYYFKDRKSFYIERSTALYKMDDTSFNINQLVNFTDNITYLSSDGVNLIYKLGGAGVTTKIIDRNDNVHIFNIVGAVNVYPRIKFQRGYYFILNNITSGSHASMFLGLTKLVEANNSISIPNYSTPAYIKVS